VGYDLSLSIIDLGYMWKRHVAEHEVVPLPDFDEAMVMGSTLALHVQEKLKAFGLSEVTAEELTPTIMWSALYFSQLSLWGPQQKG
jgi:hypothetical protein